MPSKDAQIPGKVKGKERVRKACWSVSSSFTKGGFGRFGERWRMGWGRALEEYGDGHWGED